MIPVPQYPKRHQDALVLELFLLLIPTTIAYVWGSLLLWSLIVPYAHVELGLVVEFLVISVFLWSAWVVTLAAVKGPSTLNTLKIVWWLLCGIACLLVLASWVLLFSNRFGLSWGDSMSDAAWPAYGLLGSPLLPLALHCWCLRTRFCSRLAPCVLGGLCTPRQLSAEEVGPYQGK